MRICHATTFWPNRFGHTHYTDALILGMRHHLPEQHMVAAEHGSAPLETEAIRCVPCFKRGTDYVEPLLSTVRSFGPDVVIVQYTDDIWGHGNRFVDLLSGLREAGIATIVNSHSVFPARQRRAFRPGHSARALDRAIAREAGAYMVHSHRMRQDLFERGVAADKIAVIPHGSRPMEERDMAESRRRLGLPLEGKVVLFFGFIWPGKGLEFLFDVFRGVLDRVPDAKLYIAGHTRRKVFYTRIYMAYLQARQHWLGIARHTRQWGDYVPDEMVPTIYSAADVVAMSYRQNYSSVSGVVHQTAGIGKLMLCSRIAKFSEVERQISRHLVVEPGDLHGWVEGLVRLLTDDRFAADMRSRITRFAEETSWVNTGRMHLELCRGLLAGKSAAGALGQI